MNFNEVQRSGPVFVKPGLKHLGRMEPRLGQWAATRPDLICEEICARLGQLHDATEPHPLRHTHQVLQEAFREPWGAKVSS